MTRWGIVVVVASVCTTLGARAGEPDGGGAAREWNDVYKREYAFLEAERDALARRLAEVKAESTRAVGGVEARIATLQGELVEARAAADRAEAELVVIERETSATDDTAELVPATIERARLSLAAAGVVVTPSAEPQHEADAIALLMDAAVGLMQRQGKVTNEPGTFFLRDGQRAEGRIVRLGAVMVWGISDVASGALAPAGGGHWQLWPDEARATAEAFAAGKVPAVMRGFLHDDPNKRMEPRVERSFEEYTNVGGPIAWAIVGVGALAALCILMRASIVLRAKAARRRLAARIGPILAAARAPGTGREVLQERLDHAFLAEAPRLERFSTLITVLAAIAPLLGLLGTVTGMIATFDVITEHGNSDPKLLSGGISEALITTEYGLMVAIPALFLGTLLTGRANDVITSLERDLVGGVARTLGPEVAAEVASALPRPTGKSGDPSWKTPSSEPSPTFETAAQ